MNLFRKLFKKRTEYSPLENEEQVEDMNAISRLRFDAVDASDATQRMRFVESCLEQMTEATQEMDRLQDEYHLVNSYLHDMEEIDALPRYQKEALEEHAKAIYALRVDKEQYNERGSNMKESDYRKIERIEDIEIGRAHV